MTRKVFWGLLKSRVVSTAVPLLLEGSWFSIGGLSGSTFLPSLSPGFMFSPSDNQICLFLVPCRPDYPANLFTLSNLSDWKSATFLGNVTSLKKGFTLWLPWPISTSTHRCLGMWSDQTGFTQLDCLNQEQWKHRSAPLCFSEFASKTQKWLLAFVNDHYCAFLSNKSAYQRLGFATMLSGHVILRKHQLVDECAKEGSFACERGGIVPRSYRRLPLNL